MTLYYWCLGGEYSTNKLCNHILIERVIWCIGSSTLQYEIFDPFAMEPSIKIESVLKDVEIMISFLMIWNQLSLALPKFLPHLLKRTEPLQNLMYQRPYWDSDASIPKSFELFLSYQKKRLKDIQIFCKTPECPHSPGWGITAAKYSWSDSLWIKMMGLWWLLLSLIWHYSLIFSLT